MPVIAVLFSFLFTLCIPGASATQVAHFGGAERLVTGCTTECFGVAVDGNGNVYVADTYNNQVFKATPSANGYTKTVVGTGFNLPYGVAVDQAGNVYVADTYNNQIVKETWSSGSYVPSVAVSVRNPWNLAVDNNGNLYVAGGNAGTTNQPYVYKETPSGTGYTQSVVANAASGLNIPWEVAVDAAGNVYVSDTGNNAVYKESPSGSSYTQSTVASGLNFPTGVAVDSAGLVYIANAYTNQILIATPGSGGSYTQSVLPTAALMFPYELATDANGNVYIANAQDYDVLEVSPGGVDFGKINAGAQSAPVSLVFAFDASSSISQPLTYTQGTKNLDFSDSGTGTCTTNGTSITYAASQTCIVNVVFHPTVSGVISGAAVLTDHAGNQIAVGYIRGTGVAPQLNFSPGTQSALPSQGLQGPLSLAVDGAQNIFFIDGSNVMKESYSGGQYTLSTLFSNLSMPTSVAVDGAGNIYITQVGSRSLIRETPYAGGYYQSLTATGFSLPMSVAVDSLGNVYVADMGLYEVFKVSPSASGFVTSSAVTGVTAPTSVAVDGNGLLYIGNGTEQVTVATPAASGSGYTQSVVTVPGGKATTVAADSRGNFYTVDENGGTITKWTLSAGQYAQTRVGASLSYPIAAAVDRNGNAFVLNEGSLQVLKVDVADPPSLTFAPTAYQTVSSDSPRTVSLLNFGNADLQLPAPVSGENPSLSSGFTLSESPAACPRVSSEDNAATLAAGSSCELDLNFNPQAIGSVSGSLVLTDNALNVTGARQTIALNGTATQATPVIDWATPSPVTYGNALSSAQLNAKADVAGTFTYSPAAGTLLGAGPQTLTATFTPTDPVDYKGTAQSVVLTVSPASLVVKADSQSIAYGSTLPTLTGSLTGVVSGDGITAAYSTTATAASTPGTYPITAVLSDPQSKLSNYSVSNIPGTLTIGKAAPKITWASPAAITYGTALSADQLNATASVPGTFAYSPAAGTVLHAGAQSLSVTFTPTDAATYATATATVTLTVNQATSVISWSAPTSIVLGTPLSSTQLNATASVPGTFAYNPPAGTVLPLGSNTLALTFTPTDAVDYRTATASVAISIVSSAPTISSLSPPIATAGSSAFAVTINGSGFVSGSTAYWGTTALPTQYVSGTQLTAQVPAAAVATAGATAVTVQNPATAGGTSNTMQFEVDPAGAGSGTPTFTTVTATVAAGAAASYPVAVAASARNVSATCLNLPAGATCSYSASQGAITIATAGNTPAGTYQIVVVFSEDLPSTSAGLFFLPVLLPFAFLKRRRLGGMWTIALAVLLATAVFVSGCGNSNSQKNQTQTVTSSAAVSLVVK